MRFDGKRILVTGASRGIGRALAEQLSAEGAEVLALARSAEALGGMPDSAEQLVCDLAGSSARAALIAQLQGQRLNGVVNNAGIQVTADFAKAEAAPEDIERELSVNLAAPMHLAAGLMPVLARTPGSFLVNVTSGLALAPKRQAPVYCASKAGLRSFTRALRYQADDAGLPVQVTDCVMALTDTEMTTGRGRGKLSAAEAASALLAGIAGGKDEIWVGRMKLLRLIHRLSPRLAQRILRG